MSYAYRKKKRKLANIVLTKIYEDSFYPPNSGPPDYYEHQWTVSTLTKAFPIHSWGEYRGAVELLLANKHVISRSDPNGPLDEEEQLFRTTAGIEAVHEGFYDKENQKDRLEQFEMRTRWVLPIVSILISLVALVISILNRYYPGR